MQIDFNKIDSMTFPGMNNGTGIMSARMYNDDSYRIISTAIQPGGSIGSHKQESGDDMNYIISAQVKHFVTAYRKIFDLESCTSARKDRNTLSSIQERKI